MYFDVVSQVKRVLVSATVLMAVSLAAQANDFTCEFTVTSQWGSGASASLTITNTTGQALDWENVGLSFPESSGVQISSSWNASRTGSNPYSFQPHDWNRTLQPAQSAEIGMQLAKSGSGDFPEGALSGDCGTNRAPVAVINSIYSSKGSTRVTTTGSGSDPDGDELTYTWAINGSSWGMGPSVSGEAPMGTHVFTLTVSDGELSHSVSQTHTVADEIQFPPSAKFTYTIDGLTVSFDASQSYASQGYLYSMGWNFGDGNHTSAPLDQLKLISHTYAEPGDYEVTLSVYDSKMNSASVTKTVKLGRLNTAPVAVIDISTFESLVTLDGSDSYDADGDELTYQWTVNGSPFSSHAVHSGYFSKGTFAVGLTVNDGELSHTASQTFTMTYPPTSPPVAEFGFTKDELTLNVDASASRALGVIGTYIQSYHWDFGDGTTFSGGANNARSTSHSYDAAGEYEVSLTVYDSNLESSTTTTTITVGGANTAPVAVLNLSNFEQQLIAQGSSSYDPDGEMLTYEWKVNGELVTTMNGYPVTSSTSALHSYAIGYGVHTVQLAVSDGKVTDTVTDTIIMTNPQNAPVAMATYNANGLSVTFDASASYTNVIGLSITGYEWRFGDGNTSTSMMPTHVYAEPGIYDAYLIVRDNTGTIGARALLLEVGDEPADDVECSYEITNTWGNSFEANVRIVNNSETAVSNWSVNIAYPDTSSLASWWDAEISGSGPYTASGKAWNADLQPGGTIQFGVIGNNGSATPTVATLTGSTCEL